MSIQTEQYRIRKQRLFKIRPKKTIFFSVFFLVYLASGILTLMQFIPYRMGLVSFLILPLFLLYGLKKDRILLAYIILTCIIMLSAIYNGSSIIDIILFMRILVFSYLIYYLVKIYLDKYNIERIIRICVVIAILQLPVILIQQSIYSYLPDHLVQGITHVDFDFGTFNFKGDSAMGFFLILIIVFLLFDKKRNYILSHRWFIVFWLTITILIANSELNKLIVLLVWGIFLLRYLNFKTIFLVVMIFSFIAGGLFVTGLLNETIEKFTFTILNNISIDERKQDEFLSGNYGRQSALAYYINQGVTWMGDGPGKYYDVLSRTRLRGNTGHIFTFYSEIGLLGLMTSYIIFFLIAFPIKQGRIKITWVGILITASAIILSFTTQVMNDISIFLIFCIIAKIASIQNRNYSQRIPSEAGK